MLILLFLDLDLSIFCLNQSMDQGNIPSLGLAVLKNLGAIRQTPYPFILGEKFNLNYRSTPWLTKHPNISQIKMTFAISVIFAILVFLQRKGCWNTNLFILMRNLMPVMFVAKVLRLKVIYDTTPKCIRVSDFST